MTKLLPVKSSPPKNTIKPSASEKVDATSIFANSGYVLYNTAPTV